MRIILGCEEGWEDDGTVLEVESPTLVLIGVTGDCRAYFTPEELEWEDDEVPAGCVKTLAEAQAAFSKKEENL